MLISHPQPLEHLLGGSQVTFTIFRKGSLQTVSIELKGNLQLKGFHGLGSLRMDSQKLKSFKGNIGFHIQQKIFNLLSTQSYLLILCMNKHFVLIVNSYLADIFVTFQQRYHANLGIV